MNKITMETSIVDNKMYYEIKIDGKGFCGTYLFESAMTSWIKLKDKMFFDSLQSLSSNRKTTTVGGEE